MSQTTHFQAIWKRMKELTVHSIHQLTEHLLQLRNIILRGERREIHPIIQPSQTQTHKTKLQNLDNKKAMEKEWLLRIQSFNSINPLNNQDTEDWETKMNNLAHEFEAMSLA